MFFSISRRDGTHSSPMSIWLIDRVLRFVKFGSFDSMWSVVSEWNLFFDRSKAFSVRNSTRESITWFVVKPELTV